MARFSFSLKWQVALVCTAALLTATNGLAQVGCGSATNCVSIVAPECGVYNPELCTDPVERARFEKEAEAQRQKAEAEARAREAERLRKERELTEEMKKLNMGKQREAEARRLMALKAQAEAARKQIKRDNCGVPETSPLYKPDGWHGTACPQ